MMTLNRPLSSLSNTKRPDPSLDTRASLFAPSCTVSRAPAIGVPDVVLTDPDKRHAPFDGSTGDSGWKNSLQAGLVSATNTRNTNVRRKDMFARVASSRSAQGAGGQIAAGESLLQEAAEIVSATAARGKSVKSTARIRLTGRGPSVSR